MINPLQGKFRFSFTERNLFGENLNLKLSQALINLIGTARSHAASFDPSFFVRTDSFVSGRCDDLHGVNFGPIIRPIVAHTGCHFRHTVVVLCRHRRRHNRVTIVSVIIGVCWSLQR